MFHYFNAITNTKGDALIGYYVKAVDTVSGSIVSIYADESSTPIISVSGVANACKVDSDGNASFYIVGGTYHLDIYATDAATLVKRIESIPMVDASVAAGNVATRTTLAAKVPSAGDAFTLIESGREGLFIFSTSNLSTQVTADPNQGVYVAPASNTTGASGAWVRQVGDAPHNPTWFGVSTANSGAANRTALQAMYDYLAAVGTASSGISNPYRGGGHARFPAGIFNIVGAIDLKSTVHTSGAGPARYGSGAATKLQWTDGSSGFRVQAINTSGDTTYDAVNHGGGDGSTFSDLWLDGGTPATYVYGTETGDYHAIHFKARIECRGVVVTNWSGNGFHSYAIAGAHSAAEGNANCWRLLFCEAVGCRNGLFLDGADTNAGISIGFNGTACRQAGIYDSSFLANEHHGFHLDANAETEYSVCTSASKVYSVVAGQETWCSTNAPSGTTAHNQGWRYHAAGGVGQYGARAWVSGQTWRTGGAFITDNANAYHEVSGYSEGSQLPAQYCYPTRSQGGQYAGQIEYGTTNVYGGTLSGTGLFASGLLTALDLVVGRNLKVLGQIDISADATVGYTGTDQTAILRDPTNGMVIYAPTTGSTNAFTLYAGGLQAMRVPVGTVNATFSGNVSATGTVTGSNLSGTNTGNQTITLTSDVTGSGTGSFATTIAANAVTYAKFQTVAANALVGNPTGSTATAQAITLAGGLGNSGTTLTINGAVTAATSVAIAGAITSSSATAGVGYATGAGGAVTQITSRTTGVTLNKACGAITLFSAAGSTTAATFTVTNSAVAATDTVVICQKSGTDKYNLNVSAVGAGTFDVTFATVSGTTVEQPVFNFAVIKAVAA